MKNYFQNSSLEIYRINQGWFDFNNSTNFYKFFQSRGGDRMTTVIVLIGIPSGKKY